MKEAKQFQQGMLHDLEAQIAMEISDKTSKIFKD